MSVLARIEGYAARFDAPDLIGDVIEPGAFKADCLKLPLPMLREHTASDVVGEWTRAIEDGRGLWVEGVISAPSPDRKAYYTSLLALRTIGLSIGYRVRDHSLRPAGGRLLKAIDLVEVSLTANPMVPTARARIRAPPGPGV
jgi:uncharacterized protein